MYSALSAGSTPLWGRMFKGKILDNKTVELLHPAFVAWQKDKGYHVTVHEWEVNLWYEFLAYCEAIHQEGK